MGTVLLENPQRALRGPSIWETSALMIISLRKTLEIPGEIWISGERSRDSRRAEVLFTREPCKTGGPSPLLPPECHRQAFCVRLLMVQESSKLISPSPDITEDNERQIKASLCEEVTKTLCRVLIVPGKVTNRFWVWVGRSVRKRTRLWGEYRYRVSRALRIGEKNSPQFREKVQWC